MTTLLNGHCARNVFFKKRIFQVNSYNTSGVCKDDRLLLSANLLPAYNHCFLVIFSPSNNVSWVGLGVSGSLGWVANTAQWVGLVYKQPVGLGLPT